MKQSDYLQDNLEIVKSLRKLPILQSMEERHVKGLAKLCRITQYDSGETIFEEDKFDKFLYFLISGKVKIVKKGTEVGTFDRVGDVFGEMAVIDSKARSASVIAATAVNCLKMDISYLEQLPENERETAAYVVYRVFCDILSTRLRQTTEELIKAKEEIKRLQSLPQ